MADPLDIFLTNLETLIARYGGPSDFATETGISFWTIHSWRSRTVTNPTYLSLSKVAKAAGVSVDELMGKRIK